MYGRVRPQPTLPGRCCGILSRGRRFVNAPSPTCRSGLPLVVEGLSNPAHRRPAVADAPPPRYHPLAVPRRVHVASARNAAVMASMAPSAPPPRPNANAPLPWRRVIVARILAPGSKLATARGLAADTARGLPRRQMRGIESVDEDELYAAMDWRSSAKAPSRSGRGPTPAWRRQVLYDRSSTHFEGRCCPVAGQLVAPRRDGRRLTSSKSLFGRLLEKQRARGARSPRECSTATPPTPTPSRCPHREAAPALRTSRVVLVGDRAMLTRRAVREEVHRPVRLDQCLRAPAIRDDELRAVATDVRHDHLAEIPAMRIRASA